MLVEHYRLFLPLYADDHPIIPLLKKEKIISADEKIYSISHQGFTPISIEALSLDAAKESALAEVIEEKIMFVPAALKKAAEKRQARNQLIEEKNMAACFQADDTNLSKKIFPALSRNNQHFIGLMHRKTHIST